jgi:adenine-specific DNA-methyltransferase
LRHNTTKKVSTISRAEYNFIYDSESKTFNDTFIRELESKYTGLGFSFLMPITEMNGMSWRWGRDKVEKESHEIIVVGEKGNFSLYKKQRPEIGDLPSKKPKSFLYKPEYSSGNGTAQLKNIFEKKVFNNPKPINLILDLLILGSNRHSIILDFFAGSGTTLHATMQLNSEDNGHRQCIFVTNNENNICEEVTYVRNKKVIEGYTTPRGEEVAGLKNNNLRYYKTDFISRDKTPRNMRALVNASTDLLCIKNDIYAEALFSGKKLSAKIARYFDDGKTRMLVIYDERAIAAIAELIKTMPAEPKIKIYTFSPSRYAFDDEFAEVADRVTFAPCQPPSMMPISTCCPNAAPNIFPKHWQKWSRRQRRSRNRLKWTSMMRKEATHERE